MRAILCVLVMLLGVIFPASAVATSYLYTYTGNTFTEFQAGSYWTTSDYLTVSFTLDLSTGRHEFYRSGDGLPIPVFYMSAGTYHWSSLDPNVELYYFSIGWDARGNPTSWNIQLWEGPEVSYAGGLYLWGMISYSSAQDWAGLQNEDPTNSNCCYDIHSATVNYDVGSWTPVDPLPPPPPPPQIPEPSTFALLGLGLVGLIGYGWKARR